MTKEEVSTRLCHYDLRNPDGEKDEEEIKDYKANLVRVKRHCYCDNCFYGRTKLAEYILTLSNK